MPATVTQINRVTARAALFPFSRSGERFLVRSSRFWRRQPRLLRAWPRSASAGSEQSKSEKRRSGRGDEAGEPGSPFIPPPHVGGYGRLHGYASVASRRHLTSAQPPTPMTGTPRGNDQTSDQTNAALDTPQRVRHSSPSFSTKVMQPTFRPHRKKRARKIGYRARMATPGGRKVIRARRLKGRKRLTVV